MTFQELFIYWKYKIVSREPPVNNLMEIFIDSGKSNWECYAITRDKIYFKKKTTGIIYNLIATILSGLLIYNIIKTFEKEYQ